MFSKHQLTMPEKRKNAENRGNEFSQSIYLLYKISLFKSTILIEQLAFGCDFKVNQLRTQSSDCWKFFFLVCVSSQFAFALIPKRMVKKLLKASEWWIERVPYLKTLRALATIPTLLCFWIFQFLFLLQNSTQLVQNGNDTLFMTRKFLKIDWKVFWLYKKLYWRAKTVF